MSPVPPVTMMRMPQCGRESARNPAAFMALIGKVLPLTIAGDTSAPLQIIIQKLSQMDQETVENAVLVPRIAG